MRVRLSFIGIFAYVMPAISSLYLAPMYGYDISAAGRLVIISSAVSALLGYFSSFLISDKSKLLHAASGSKLERQISKVLMTIGAVAMVSNLVLSGSIPLFSLGDGRVLLQGSVLWNVYIFCSVGVFLYSRATLGSRGGFVGKLLVFTYVFIPILTAWRGTFLLVLILYYSPRVKVSPPSFVSLFALFILLSGGFLLVSFARSGVPFSHVLQQPVFYLIWGFVNFDAEAIGAVSSCFHSIPLIGCKFSVENSSLINPTWNVFTALSPIYIDGGIALVVCVFFVLSLAMGVLERRNVGIVGDYVYFLIFYFFAIAHNGYSFYSKSFFVSLLMVVAIFTLGQLAASTRKGLSY